MSSKQPNVLVVFTDQQRWDTAGCYGNPMGLTPNLDAMGQRGTFFEHAFTCQPVCSPARASIQTGMYAEAAGVYRNGLVLAEHLQTLPKCFNAAGYQTGYIGKWHLAAKRTQPVPEELRGGYQFWLGSDVLEFTSHPYDGTVFDNANKSVRLRGYRADALTDFAIQYIRDNKDRPFFLFLSYIEPHQQNDMRHMVAPDGYAERYRDPYIPGDLVNQEGDWKEELPDYYGICARLDECLGKMLNELEKLEIAEHTIVVFTSDHGCHFRTRNREYKRSSHESSIRIPMVFDGASFRCGRSIPQLVSLVDIPPTLLSGCGLPIPEQMQGRDMTQLLSSETPDWENEVFVQISETQVGRAIRTERWKYCAIAPDKDRMQDSGSDVYVDHLLYDLQDDPYELTNLVGRPEYDDILKELRERLRRRIVAAGEKQPRITSP